MSQHGSDIVTGEDILPTVAETYDSLRHLQYERDLLVARLTRFIGFTQTSGSDQLLELETRLDHIVHIIDLFDKVQTAIEKLDKSELKTDNRESFENSYYKGVSLARNIVLTHRASIAHTPGPISYSAQPATSFGKSLLPPIDLPKFDGDYRKWIFFYKRFIALVDQNPTLSKVEKLYYLQGRLQGQAAQIIQDIELTDDNYSTALKLLTDRYENKRVIIDKHITDLFDTPSVTAGSPVQLRKLIDNVKQHLRALTALGEPTKSWDKLLIHLIKHKLDTTTRDRWQEKAHSQVIETSLTLDDFFTFLVKRCEYLESIEKPGHHKGQNHTKPNHVDHPNKSHSKPSYAFTVTRDTHQSEVTYSCFYCKQSHPLYKCSSFLNLPLRTKYQELRKLGLCTNCLRKGHTNSQCKSGSCRLCPERHNTLLHSPDNSEQTFNSHSHTSTTIDNPGESVSSHQEHRNHSDHSAIQSSITTSSFTDIIAHSSEASNLVLLSTAIIYIQDHSNKLIKARALLDVGSQSNYITQDLAQRLHLPLHDVNISVTGVERHSTHIFKRLSTNIKSMHSDYQINLPFLVIQCITDKLPSTSFDITSLNIPSHIHLADSTLHQPGTIDLLIGASIFYDLLEADKFSLGNKMPLLQATKFGWILAGQISFPQTTKPTKTFCSLSLRQQLVKLWEVEETPAKKLLSIEEQFCEQTFTETTTRDNDGRFIVKFPFKESFQRLGNSKPIALNRLNSIQRRFKNDSIYRELYINFITEYLELNHMELLNSDHDNDTPAFYLPHHGVRKDSSSTTKLRVVFDGSATTDSGVSLNDCLGVGPQIQDNLFDIVIRFRIHAYIMTADIQKMYRMVVIHPDHRRFQRIFWRDSDTSPIQTFEISRLAYGLASAPFLATRCLHELAYQHMADYPTACHAILHDFFVDDLITGCDSLSDLATLRQEIAFILQSGGFELRKWSSNHHSIIENQSTEQQPFCEKTELKTLGLVWNSDKDCLQYTNERPISRNNIITKRNILSNISKIFDPLGLIGPTVIKAKIILQQLWQSQSTWDDPVPSHILDQWNHFINHFQSISQLAIPRHVVCIDAQRIELHGFCDASEAAYGCCIYLRSVSFNHCMVKLLCAKSRVAPLKRLTMPRLELCGALLLSRLLGVVQSALSKPLDQICLYSDSQIVLAWLVTQPCHLQTFVANRVVEINELAPSCNWYHISSSDNPADIISRGINPDQLCSCDFWWNGPTFLQDISFQPHSPIKIPVSDLPEIKVKVISLANQLSADFSIFSRYSSFSKLQRIVAYILRFKTNCLSQTKKIGALSVDELDSSLFILCKLTQLSEFGADIDALSKDQSLPKSSRLLNLNPFLDTNHILRVGGRLEHANVTFYQKHPIILPPRHPFTESLIRHEHYKHFHAGPQLLLSIIRLRFWPLAGRSTIKRVLRKCIRCFRVKPVMSSQLMGNLPVDRFSTQRAFLKCAVDYAGPVNIKTSLLRNAKIVKAYICVFVCLSTKAAHIELVSDLSTNSFFNSLKRFTSRRGKPSDVFSDNGTNFVGCNNELQALYKLLSSPQFQTDVHTFAANDHIKWHFIPAKSPHMGGLWEAAVKSVKHHLTRVIAHDTLTFEELSTLLAQVEACLNSRPLTPLSPDSSDLSPLTPARFLIGESLVALPEERLTDVPPNRLSRYRRLQQIQQHFWNRWSLEYLGQLQSRTKWKQQTTSLLVPGTLVVLKEDHLPPLKWCMGRIIDTFPGRDGVVRVVSVKISSGAVLRRAVSKVCPLPLSD